jgi:holin-like protein
LKLAKLFTIIFQLAILLLLNEVGKLIVKFTHFPLPGNVMGMLLLFILLWTGVVRLQWVDVASGFLIKHLSFFFIPISVGLMTLGSVFIKSGLGLITALVISTLLGIIVSGTLSQALVKRKEAVHVERSYNHL